MEEISEKMKTKMDEFNMIKKAKIFRDRVSFRLLKDKYKYKIDINDNKSFHVHIVCLEVNHSWILGKFAIRMKNCLEEMGIKVTIGEMRDESADINHHIAYMNVKEVLNDRTTVMITHVDSQFKLDIIRRQVKQGAMEICMSRETMERLTREGVDRTKLCYINPAHDNVIIPKKYILGITHRNYKDFRKNPNIIVDICEQINPKFFCFKIMGEGWETIVENIKQLGFEVEYYPEFDYDIYTKLIPSLDYYIYYGFDEGSMGYLDALAAGIDTIVTPQGYHLDIKGGPTYCCETVKDFVNVLNQISNRRENIVESVEDLTWEAYSFKHLEIWYYLTKRKELGEILRNRSYYMDGIFSILLQDIKG